MTRVSVVGSSCSGKATLSRRLSAALGVPHIELDTIHWRPNWTPLPIDQFRKEVEKAAAGDRWVIHGSYSKVWDIIWARATDIVWMNLPFRTVFWRAISRTARRVITQEELFAGNQETLRLAFIDRHLILWWVIHTYHRRRREYEGLLSCNNHNPFKVYGRGRKTQGLSAWDRGPSRRL
jgi:adenylate kinase family enzyme